MSWHTCIIFVNPVLLASYLSDCQKHDFPVMTINSDFHIIVVDVVTCEQPSTRRSRYHSYDPIIAHLESSLYH